MQQPSTRGSVHLRAICACLLLVAIHALADDRLHGTWRSDHDESMRFAREHSLLAPNQIAFLDQILGHLELSFDPTTTRSFMPDVQLDTNGKRSTFKGTDESFRYRVLGADEDSIVLYVEKEFGRDRIIHIHFVGNDQFWIYSEESKFPLQDLNFREYFRRIAGTRAE